MDAIFSNILDIHETTIKFYSMLEAAVEMADEDSRSKKSPLVGDCFEEMAEVSIFFRFCTCIDLDLSLGFYFEGNDCVISLLVYD